MSLLTQLGILALIVVAICTIAVTLLVPHLKFSVWMRNAGTYARDFLMARLLFIATTWNNRRQAAGFVIQKSRDLSRGWQWYVMSAVLLLWLSRHAPQQVGVLGYGVAKVSVGVVLGYIADRTLFPYARPHKLKGWPRSMAMIRRALVVGLIVLSLALLV